MRISAPEARSKLTLSMGTYLRHVLNSMQADVMNSIFFISALCHALEFLHFGVKLHALKFEI